MRICLDSAFEKWAFEPKLLDADQVHTFDFGGIVLVSGRFDVWRMAELDVVFQGSVTGKVRGSCKTTSIIEFEHNIKKLFSSCRALPRGGEFVYNQESL